MKDNKLLTEGKEEEVKDEKGDAKRKKEECVEM